MADVVDLLEIHCCESLQLQNTLLTFRTKFAQDVFQNLSAYFGTAIFAEGKL